MTGPDAGARSIDDNDETYSPTESESLLHQQRALNTAMSHAARLDDSRSLNTAAEDTALLRDADSRQSTVAVSADERVRPASGCHGNETESLASDAADRRLVVVDVVEDDVLTTSRSGDTAGGLTRRDVVTTDSQLMQSVNADSQINVMPDDACTALPASDSSLPYSRADEHQQPAQSNECRVSNSGHCLITPADVDTYCQHLVSAAESTVSETHSNTVTQREANANH